MCAKNPVRMIESIYLNLDTILYVTEIKSAILNDTWNRMGGEGSFVLSHREELLNERMWERMHNTYMSSIFSVHRNIGDSVQRGILIDSIRRDLNKTVMDRSYTVFNNRIANTKPVFVLNINFYQDSDNRLFLCADTTRLNFNMFFFGRPVYPIHYIFVYDGEIEISTRGYPTVSVPIARNVRQAFRRIMRKQPEYLLWAPQLHGMNTILYVLNDKIYVFRIFEMGAYELNEYLKKFPVETWHRQPRMSDSCCYEYSHCVELRW